MRKIKTKVIDCTVLIERPKNRLMKFVFTSNSIDSVVLDLQELYPNENITRKSVLTWKFLTVAEWNKMQEEIKNPSLMRNEKKDESIK